MADEPLDAAGDPTLPKVGEATTMWAFTRPTPVLLEPPRFVLPSVSIAPAPGLRQASLAAAMVVAFAILFTSRLANPELSDRTGAVAGVQGTPAVTSAPPSRTRRPLVAAPTTEPATSASPGGSAAPGATAPTAPSPRSPAPAVPAVDRTYTVKSGDTLYAIAARHETTVKAVADLNGLGDGSYIKIGQKLRIP